MRAPLPASRWAAFWQSLPVLLALVVAVASPLAMAARAKGHPILRQWAAAYTAPYSTADQATTLSWAAPSSVAGSGILLQDRESEEDVQGMNAVSELGGRQFTDPNPATMNGTPLDRGSILNSLYLSTDPIVVTSGFFPMRKLVEQMSVWMIFPLIILSILVGVTRGSPDQEMVMGAKRLIVVMALLWAYPLWDIVLTRGIAFPVAKMLLSPEIRDVFLVQEAQRRGIGTGPGTAEAKRDTLRMFLYGRSVALDSSVRANGNLTRGVPDSLKPSHWGMMSNYYTNDLSCAVRLAGEGLGGDPVVAVDSTKVRTISSTGGATTRRSLAKDPREVQIRDMAALQPDFRQKINQLVMVLERRNFDVTITETLRIQARQEYLYEQGRTRPGPQVTWTLNSNHRSGYAVDFFLNKTWRPEPYLEMRRVAAAIPGLGWLPDKRDRNNNPVINDAAHIEMVGRFRTRLTVDQNQVTSNKRAPGTVVRTAAGNEAVVADGNSLASGAAQSVEEAGLYRCVGDEVPGVMHGMHTVSWVGLSTKQLENKEQVVDRVQSGWKSLLLGKFAAIKTFVAGAASSIATAGKWGFGLMKAFITGDWSAVAEMILEAFLGIVMQLVNFLTAALMWFLWLRMVLSRVVSLTFAPFALAMGIRGQGLVPEGTKRWFKGHAEICLQPVGLALISLVFFMMTTLIHSDRTFIGPRAYAPTEAAPMVASAGPAGGGVLLAMAQGPTPPPATPRDTVVTLPQGFNPRNIDVLQIDSLRFDSQQRGLLRDIPNEPVEVKRIPVSLRFAIAVILVFLAISADKISKALAGEIGQIGSVVGKIVEGRARQTAFLAARLTAEAGAAVLTGGASVARAAAAEVAQRGMKGIAKEGVKSVAKASIKAGGKEMGKQVQGAARRGFRRVASGVLGAAVGSAGMVMSREEAEEQGLLGDRPTLGQQERTDALAAFEQTERQLQAEFGSRAPTGQAVPGSLTGAPASTWDAAMLLEGMGAAETPAWSVAPDLASTGRSVNPEGVAAVAGLGGWLAARGALPASRAQSIERVLDGRLDINRVVEMLMALPAQRQAEILATVKRGGASANLTVDAATGTVGATEWKELLGRQGTSVLGAAPEVLGAAQWERGTGALIGEAMRSYPEWAAALSQMAPDGRWEEMVQGGLLADGETWLSAGIGRERKLGALGIGADDPLRNLLQALDAGTFTALTQGAGSRDAIKTRLLDLVVPVVVQQSGALQSGAGQADSIDVILERLNMSVPPGSAQRGTIDALIQVQRGTGASLSPAIWAGLGAVALGAQATQRARMQQVVQRTAEAGALGFDIAAWQSSGGRTEAYRASAQSALAVVAQADATLPVDLQFAVATQALEQITGRAAGEGAALQALSAEQLAAVKVAITEQVLPQAQLAALGTSPQELLTAVGATDLTRLGSSVPLRKGSLAAGVLGASAATAVEVGAALPQMVGQALSQPSVREEVRAAIANGVNPTEAILAATGVASQAKSASGAAMEQLLTLTTQADAAISQAAQSVVDTAKPSDMPVAEQAGGEITVVAQQTGFGVAQSMRFEDRLASAFSLNPEGATTAERSVAVIDAGGQGGATVPTAGVKTAVESLLATAEPVSASASVAARFEAAGVLDSPQVAGSSEGSPLEGRAGVGSGSATSPELTGDDPLAATQTSAQVVPAAPTISQRAAEAFHGALELPQTPLAGGPVIGEPGTAAGAVATTHGGTGEVRKTTEAEIPQRPVQPGDASSRQVGDLAPEGVVRENLTPERESSLSPEGRLGPETGRERAAAASFEEAEKTVAERSQTPSGGEAERMAAAENLVSGNQDQLLRERGSATERPSSSSLDTTPAGPISFAEGAAVLSSERRLADAWTEATKEVAPPQERSAGAPREGLGALTDKAGSGQPVSGPAASTPQQPLVGTPAPSEGTQAAPPAGTGVVNPWDQALETVSAASGVQEARPLGESGKSAKEPGAERPTTDGSSTRPGENPAARRGTPEAGRVAESRSQEPAVKAFESAEAVMGLRERPVDNVERGAPPTPESQATQGSRADGVAQPPASGQERMSSARGLGGEDGRASRGVSASPESASDSSASADVRRTQGDTQGAQEISPSIRGGAPSPLRDAVAAAFAPSGQPSPSAQPAATSEQAGGRAPTTASVPDQESTGALGGQPSPASRPETTSPTPPRSSAAKQEAVSDRAATAVDSFAGAIAQAAATRGPEPTAPVERAAAAVESAPPATTPQAAPARGPEPTPTSSVERAATTVESAPAATPQAASARGPEPTPTSSVERAAAAVESAPPVATPQAAPAREPMPTAPVERAAATVESVPAATPQAAPARGPEPTPSAPVERAAAAVESAPPVTTPQGAPARGPEPTPTAPVERASAVVESAAAATQQLGQARGPEPTPTAPVERAAAVVESAAAATQQLGPARGPEPTPSEPVERTGAGSESTPASTPQAAPARGPEPTPTAPVERAAVGIESAPAATPQAAPAQRPEPTPTAPVERAAAALESAPAAMPQSAPPAPESSTLPAGRASAVSESEGGPLPQGASARTPEPPQVEGVGVGASGSGGAPGQDRAATVQRGSEAQTPVQEVAAVSSRDSQEENQPVAGGTTAKSGMAKNAQKGDDLPPPPAEAFAGTTSSSVNERLGLSTGFVEFQGPSGSALPLSERIRITSPAGARLQIEAVQYEGDASGWLETKGNDTVRPTAVTVTASLRDLPPGVHRASVQVTNQQPGGGAVLLQVVLVAEEGGSTPQNLLEKVLGSLAHASSELRYNRGIKTESSAKIRRELDEIVGLGRALVEYGPSDSVSTKKERAWRMRESVRSADRSIASVVETEALSLTGRSALDGLRRALRELDKQVVALRP